MASGERVLVAVSGGPDSTALLHALVQLGPRLGIQVMAATVDHGLRPESPREAALVVERCRDLGVNCQIATVDVRGARRAHVSWQDAARRVRLAALEELAGRLGCARIALGHTANDQAESKFRRGVALRRQRQTAACPAGLFLRPHAEHRLHR